MSDRPTFWFKCSRAHIEERPMPGDGELPLCDALIHDDSPDGGRVRCGCELRHIGPTVAEWRATNDAKHQADVKLAAADAALAECGDAIDQLSAERDELRTASDHRLAAAIRERDLHRTQARDYWARLDAVRAALRAEAARLDTKRPNFANRLRGIVAETWTLAEQIKQEEALADELAEPSGLVRIGADPDGPGSIAEVEWTRAGGTRLKTFLGRPPGEWQNALHELRTIVPPPSQTGPEMIMAAVRELRGARNYKRRQERRSRSFTLVRDVNGQTEEALARCERSRADELIRRCDAERIAAWAVSALTKVPHDYGQAHAAYQRAIDAESESEVKGGHGPIEPMVYEPALIDALHDLEGKYGLGGIRSAIDNIWPQR